MTRPIYISLIGPSDASPEVLRIAEEAGGRIARAGAILVTGGGSGAMEAACRGAREAGGVTVGLLAGGSREDGNPYLDVAIPTGIGEMRNALVVRAGDAVLAVGGGYGTLSEVALALKLDKPLVTVASWSASLDGAEVPVPAAATPEEAVEWLLGRLGLPK